MMLRISRIATGLARLRFTVADNYFDHLFPLDRPHGIRLEILARGWLLVDSIHDTPDFAQRRVSYPSSVTRRVLCCILYYHRSILQ